MPIQAKDALAGARYRCVDTGDLIEICARPQDSRNAKLVPLTTEDKSFIHVNAIGVGNRKLPSPNPARPLVIPAFYKLEPYDGPYTRPPERRVVVPKPKSNGNVGRPKKGAIPWRGRAVKIRYDMERILETIEDEGLWIAETFHYYRAGLNELTCLGVFKSGQLGFHSRPDGPLGQFPARPLTSDPYLPWKVELPVVLSAGKWDAMLEMLQRYLREFKSRTTRRARR